MDRMTVAKVAELAGAELVYGSADREVDKVVRDSRDAVSGSVFFALIGENNNGHRYLEQVYQNECRVFVISEDQAQEELSKYEDVSVLKVKNTHQAMYTMAEHYLAQFDIPKIAITGSSGKTTTKDMLFCMLSSKYRTVANQKNYNNDIGVCLTAFDVDSTTEIAVFEMGMNHADEIHLLAKIVRPQIAGITNVGNAHIGNLGSRENIMKAKMEITDYMDETSTLVYNTDNDMLATLAEKETPYHKLAVGYNAEQDGVIMVILNQSGEEGIVESSPSASGEEGITFILRYQEENMMFYLAVPGVYNASNAAVAVGCALTAGMDLADCSNAIMNLKLSEDRMKIMRSGGIRILNDTYNANPAAAEAAIDVLASVYGQRRVAILADMLELGDHSEALHRATGAYAAQKKIDVLITIGSEAAYIADEARKQSETIQTYSFNSHEEFENQAEELIEYGDSVLIKGSHSMHMDQVVDFLKKMGTMIDRKEQEDE